MFSSGDFNALRNSARDEAEGGSSGLVIRWRKPGVSVTVLSWMVTVNWNQQRVANLRHRITTVTLTYS